MSASADATMVGINQIRRTYYIGPCLSRFAKLIFQHGQLAKAYIEVYGNVFPDIQEVFPDYASLQAHVKGVGEAMEQHCSDDMWYELQFHYNNMTES
jgi:hypothetical protein